MLQSLKPGENTSLSQAKGQVRVSHTAGANLDINLTAFLVTDSGKVINDNDMVFFNAPHHASGAASFISPSTQGSSVTHCIDFDLSRLPANITKIAITLTQDGSAGGFASVNNLRAQVLTAGSTLEFAPGIFSQETGIIVLELYVRNGQNKARAVWQGFASGLAGLCHFYGVEVEEPMPVAVTAPPPVNMEKKRVTLTKPDSSHKISLLKGAAAPKSIRVSATWIDNGDGRKDNDDLDLRVGILRPDGQMSIIQAPDKSGAFNADPFVFHTGDVVTASVSAPGCETVEINPEISRLMGGKVALVCSVYSALSNGIVAIASLKPTMRMEYGDQIVDCAFEFKKGFFNSMVYTYVIGIIEIDRDNITLRPSGVTSRAGSESTPWLTRTGDELTLTMDGPYVFKGKKVSSRGNKRYI
ncbi:stress response protein TerZ [Limnobaculum zhutongyuii]|uniref:Stress response protein TerZ n=1 Tax=Limnobaculum zhutongyuii TaxID=2498113 RepID=A0A411WN91_9GAMM|nr:TerD family protein [Limnobaculum zhutongyuii]QBH97600.1 stress response protein TerZ [Limnobaculum zhutongyuii]TQS91075.1 stress response protein TerZ [Limnobaculum zhutongyuii]